MRLRALETHLRYLENAANTDEILFPPSSIGPDAHWTSQDKALFFKSIARHSRWRPDLIAEDLGGTKTVGDIWTYIQLLDEGSAAYLPVPSNDPPLSAREMSRKWIANEEKLAEEIISNEDQWLHHTNLKARSDYLLSLEEMSTGSVSDTDAPHDVRFFNDKKKRLKRQWRKQDFTSKLDLCLLKKMDRISHNLLDTGHSQNRPDTDVAPQVRDRLFSMPDLSHLKLAPLERKRLRQRLWLRQKRAIQSGSSPSKAPTSHERVKAGPKSRSGSQNKKLIDEISAKNVNIEEFPLRDEKEPLKINRDPESVLERHDITKDSLFKDGLDIFHLENFATLSGLFGRVFGPEDSQLSSQHFIAYDLLCYLRASLVQFLTLVIGMAITHRTTSIRQRRIDEFTPDIDVSRENVLASLLLLGQNVDKDQLLERMSATLLSKQVDGAISDQGELTVNLNNSNSTRLPFMMNEFSFLANSSITDFTSCMPMSSNEDILIGEDMDEKRLLADLAAEEALEQEYKLADRIYEGRLWTDGEDETEVN